MLKERKKDRIGSFFQGKSLAEEEAAGPAEAVASSLNTASRVIPYDISDDVLDAEILWCLYIVDTHLSYRSCNPMPNIFKRMFKTCPLAQKFQMKKDKCRYMIMYGLYPAFKAPLESRICSSPWFSVSFDESYNRHQQKCQLDVNIRYWDKVKNIAESAYYDSKFLLRPNIENLKDELFSSIEKLDKSKFLHMGMDGPTTNWKVLQLVDGMLSDGGFVKTMDIGSCSLHILHGAFSTGIQKTGWKLGKLIKVMFKILDESSARHDVYLREGTSGKLPLKFSDTRWIEDEPVADRALEVWPSMVATVKHWEGLTKSS